MNNENRPKMVNNNWGGTIEDNSFGTHEFLNLCELLGCEPYISANVGSGTVEEMAKWIEYMTSEGDSPMARLRRQNIVICFFITSSISRHFPIVQ